MNSGGDAAEQIVRMSLEGTEVALRITGNAAKNIAVLIIAALKEEGKTKGKARLSGMLKSGKELKVFSIQNKDLKRFTKEARKYGVLYNVIRQKDNRSPFAEVDIIARAEDAAKISRIIDKFKLATVDKAEVVRQVELDRERRKEAGGLPEPERNAVQPDDIDRLLDEALAKPARPERNTPENPQAARTEKSIPSGQNYREAGTADTFKEGAAKKQDKPSVRAKIKRLTQQAKERSKVPQNEKLQVKPKSKGETTKGR